MILLHLGLLTRNNEIKEVCKPCSPEQVLYILNSAQSRFPYFCIESQKWTEGNILSIRTRAKLANPDNIHFTNESDLQKYYSN